MQSNYPLGTSGSCGPQYPHSPSEEWRINFWAKHRNQCKDQGPCYLNAFLMQVSHPAPVQDHRFAQLHASGKGSKCACVDRCWSTYLTVFGHGSGGWQGWLRAGQRCRRLHSQNLQNGLLWEYVCHQAYCRQSGRYWRRRRSRDLFRDHILHLKHCFSNELGKSRAMRDKHRDTSKSCTALRVLRAVHLPEAGRRRRGTGCWGEAEQ